MRCDDLVSESVLAYIESTREREMNKETEQEKGGGGGEQKREQEREDAREDRYVVTSTWEKHDDCSFSLSPLFSPCRVASAYKRVMVGLESTLFFCMAVCQALLFLPPSCLLACVIPRDEGW
jgi:hypothetical protein